MSSSESESTRTDDSAAPRKTKKYLPRRIRNQKKKDRKVRQLEEIRIGKGGSIRCTLLEFLDNKEEAKYYYYNYKYVNPELKKDNFSIKIAIINAYTVRTLAKRDNY